MAKLKGSILGKLRGTVGDFTSRVFKGENIVCDLPASFTPPNDDRTIARRRSFALSSKFTRAINSVPDLKAIWDSRKPVGTNAYNFIFKTNYRQMVDGMITDLNTITPLFGFPVTASSINLTVSPFQVEIAPLTSASLFDTSVEVNVRLIMLSFLSGPVDTQGEDFFLKPLQFDSIPLALDVPLVFSVALTGEDELPYKKYNLHKAYIALVTLDSNGNPVKFSETITNK